MKSLSDIARDYPQRPCSVAETFPSKMEKLRIKTGMNTGRDVAGLQQEKVVKEAGQGGF